jgi:hypothetical protein
MKFQFFNFISPSGRLTLPLVSTLESQESRNMNSCFEIPDFTCVPLKSLVSSRTGNSLAQFKGDLTLEFSLA